MVLEGGAAPLIGSSSQCLMNALTGRLDYFCLARHPKSAVSSALRFLVSDYGCLISLPAYSFTCANGICENNCRSMIMFSRRSN
jgi:hypothetical protein